MKKTQTRQTTEQLKPGSPLPHRVEPQVSSPQQWVLSLQRTAGNAAVGAFLSEPESDRLVAQRAGSGAAVAEPEATPAAPSFAVDAAETLALELGKTIIEKGCPPAKIVIIAAELGYAMGESCGKALLAANTALSARYEADVSKALVDTGDGITAEGYKALQDIRRWQAHSVAACYEIIKQTLIAGGEKALEIAAKEVASYLLKKPIEHLSEGFAKWVTHFVEEEQAAELANKAVGHSVEKTIAKCLEVVQEAFVKTAVVLSFDKGKETLTEHEAKKRALEAGASPEVAAGAAKSAAAEHMTLEAVGDDVEGKVKDVSAGMPSRVSKYVVEGERKKLQDRYQNFTDHYEKILELHKKYEAMGAWGRWRHDEEAATLKDQLAVLNVDAGSDLDLMEINAPFETFKVDKDVIFDGTHPK